METREAGEKEAAGGTSRKVNSSEGRGDAARAPKRKEKRITKKKQRREDGKWWNRGSETRGRRREHRPL